MGAGPDLVKAIGDADSAAQVAVAPSWPVGPLGIDIWNRACSRIEGREVSDSLEPSAFTVLPPPLPIVEMEGTFYYENIEVAVDTDGTVLLPFDLTNIIAPMQFYVSFHELPLRFDEDGITYYNKDEYNLKLFENMVTGPDDYQWGAYYGTTVHDPANLADRSDLVSYWRHEFESYSLAHLPGGSHEVDAMGEHPDGSLHVDHNLLIAAFSGQLGEGDDPSQWENLSSGSLRVTVEVRQLLVDDSVEPADLTTAQRQTLDDNTFVVTVDPSGQVTVKETNAYENNWDWYTALINVVVASLANSETGSQGDSESQGDELGDSFDQFVRFLFSAMGLL